MKTDPTASISGAAGMPLGYEAIQSGRDSANNTGLQAKSNEAISDTLETTDREGDGRQVFDPLPETQRGATDPPETHDRLDVTG